MRRNPENALVGWCGSTARSIRRYLIVVVVLLSLQAVSPPIWAQEAPVSGQSTVRFPAFDGRPLVDLADLLSESEEDRIERQLRSLFLEDGVERVVVTIPSFEEYGFSGDALDYAIALGDAWEIGGEDRDDGILFLVALEDRGITIALGVGYGHEHDRFLQAVIDEVMVPRFREERYADGLVTALRIVSEVLSPAPVEKAPDPDAID